MQEKSAIFVQIFINRRIISDFSGDKIMNAHVRALIIYWFLVFLFVRKFESVSFAFVFDLQRETQ